MILPCYQIYPDQPANFVLRVSLAFLFLICIAPAALAQGKLDLSKDQIKQGKNRPIQVNEQAATSDEDPTEDFVGWLAVQTIRFVVWESLIGKYDRESHLSNGLTKFPYSNGTSGNYQSADPDEPQEKNFRLDVSTSLGYDYENIIVNHTNVKLRPFDYFYLQGDFTQLIESNLTKGGTDQLTIVNGDFGYDRLRFEKFNLGWTVGLRYLGSGVNELGSSFGANTEIFFLRPFSLYSSARFGQVNGIRTNQFDAKVKYFFSEVNIAFGFEHYQLGTSTYNLLTCSIGLSL